MWVSHEVQWLIFIVFLRLFPSPVLATDFLLGCWVCVNLGVSPCMAARVSRVCVLVEQCGYDCPCVCFGTVIQRWRWSKVNGCWWVCVRAYWSWYCCAESGCVIGSQGVLGGTEMGRQGREMLSVCGYAGECKSVGMWLCVFSSYQFGSKSGVVIQVYCWRCLYMCLYAMLKRINCWVIFLRLLVVVIKICGL